MERVLLAALFLCPLIFCLDLYDTFDLPKMLLSYATAAALASIFLWNACARNEWTWRSSAVDAPLALFLIITVLSAAFSIEKPLSVFGAYRTYVFALMPTVAFSVVYVMTRQMESARLRRAAEYAMLGSAAFAAIYGIMQWGGLEIFNAMPGVAGGRVWSSLGNPVYFGALCGMAFPLAVCQFATADSSFKRGANAAGALLVLAGLLLSQSRGAWLGSFLGVAFAYWRLGSAPLRKDGHAGVFFIGLCVAATVAAAAISPGIRGRVKILFSIREESNASRIAGWKGGLHIVRDHPWLGTGPDTFSRAFRNFRSQNYVRVSGDGVTQAHAHNDWIQIASTEGLLGLASFGWLIGIAAFALYRAPAERAGLTGALIALAIQNQFNFSSVSTSLWGAAALALALPEGKLHASVRPLPLAARRLVQGGVIAGCAFAMRALWQPLSADLLYMSSQAAVQSQRYPRALEELREATRRAPSIEPYETARANVAKTLAQEIPDGALRRSLIDEAWGCAQDAVRRHPRDPDAWNNEGVAAMWMTQLFQQDQSAAARAAFAKAAELDPAFVDAWANLAKWEHLSGRLDDEKALWRRVLLLDPSHAMARQVLGL